MTSPDSEPDLEAVTEPEGENEPGPGSEAEGDEAAIEGRVAPVLATAMRLVAGMTRVLALLGGIVLVAVMAVSVVSVIGRSLPLLFSRLFPSLLPHNIPGDLEIVQIGTAVAVFCFLPWCHLRHGHVVIDVFTRRWPKGLRVGLDIVANFLLMALATLILRQTWLGLLDKLRDGGSSMVLRIPESWPYVVAVAAAALMVLVTVHVAVGHWVRLVSGEIEESEHGAETVEGGTT